MKKTNSMMSARLNPTTDHLTEGLASKENPLGGEANRTGLFQLAPFFRMVQISSMDVQVALSGCPCPMM